MKFAQGTPSDTIAFVNAFKVTCQVVLFFLKDLLIFLMDVLLKTIIFCVLLLGMAYGQKERATETPKGEYLKETQVTEIKLIGCVHL